MNEPLVKIHGHIGPSYVDPAGKLNVGVELLDVVSQVQNILNLNPKATNIPVSVISPGGYEDIGSAIYDYLVSLKKEGRTITTIQNGLVGSIATKIFMAGDERIADDRFKFWIHNPFVEDELRLDADAARKLAESLDVTEKNLRKFYAEFTGLGVTDVALDELMKVETGLTAEQCLNFKFATKRKQVPAFNVIKKNMSKETEKGFMDHIKSFFEKETKKPVAVVPKKAQLPENTLEKKSMLVSLADNAGQIWLETEDLAVLDGVACYMVDATGAPTQEPVADGSYKLENGTMITIAGGVVTTSQPAEQQPDPNAPQDTFNAQQVQEMIAAALEKNKAETEAAINDIKSKMVIGKRPVAPTAILNKMNTTEQTTHRTIASVMKKKQEERKEFLVKNK